MASSLPSSQLLLLASLIFFTFSDNLVLASSEDDKVNLNLYYESLCPYCQSFIAESLVKVFSTDLYTITNLRLVPFGNAKIVSSNVVCQHGEDECYLNAIEACAIHIWPDQKEHFSFIRCVESSPKVGDDPTAAWKACADKFGGSQQIQDCHDSGLSSQLILGYANETNSLKPPHEYVPWVTVNNTPLYYDMENFVSQVCKAYKGTEIPLPKICSSSSIQPKPKQLSSTRQACFVGKAV
ncbi:PREDICTED: gamma-interferon-inducible lysosomal thiol reductase-like [Tarenaya hassleriana]|uniref:gamma-interferon-inducible lysosomal thiol reductase-like n=1 Tax=Tarenaya hassleriana TaxID=28532 RepID=UPI00053C8784|nr:PREDICTED: gamma-interferon-inducible lysosomal thiol reductase-like [Tarenaya hassleriana]